MTIGRGGLTDISLQSDSTLSRVHAVLQAVADGWSVRDVGSRNGTFVNGERIGADRMLRAGDEVRAGSLRLVLHAASAGTDAETADAGSTPEGTVTIVFTDIEDSTAIAERLGDRRWADRVIKHERFLRTTAVAHGGREVKSQGDGLMLAFTSARGAVEFALNVQRQLASSDEDDPLAVRVGIHTGEAIRTANDFLGRTVIVAARIAALCNGGQIAASSIVRSLLADQSDLVFDEGRAVALKGLREPQFVHLLDWAS